MKKENIVTKLSRSDEVEQAENEKDEKLPFFENARSNDELRKVLILARTLYEPTKVVCLEDDCEFWMSYEPKEMVYVEKDELNFQKGFCLKDEIVISFGEPAQQCLMYVYSC